MALLFADDFNALAASPQGLQQAVNVTYEWCCKWRMKANVGPSKSAVMLFNPQSAPTPLVNGDVMLGEEPLPVVDKYKYLGVMLATDCTWHAHVEHVVAKATKASYAMGSVLHIQSQVGHGDPQSCVVGKAEASVGILLHGVACSYRPRAGSAGGCYEQSTEALPGCV